MSFEKVIAPQPGEMLTRVQSPRAGEREKIEKVVAYWPAFGCWEVEIINDRGHRSDGRGNPIVRSIRPAGFGEWQEMPSR